MLWFSQHNSFKLLCCGFSGRWHVGHRSLTPHPKAKKLFLQTKNKILNSWYFNGCKLSKCLASHLPVYPSLSVRCTYRASMRHSGLCTYALCVLRKHGLCDDSLHDIFRAVAVAKLMYASNAWWGFCNANDRQKIFAFIRRCIRTGFCPPDLHFFGWETI